MLELDILPIPAFFQNGRVADLQYACRLQAGNLELAP